MICKITTFCLKNYYWNFCWMTKSDPPWAIICIGISSHSRPQCPRCRHICRPHKYLGWPRWEMYWRHWEPTCGSPEPRAVAVDDRVQSSFLVVEHLDLTSSLRILLVVVYGTQWNSPQSTCGHVWLYDDEDKPPYLIEQPAAIHFYL